MSLAFATQITPSHQLAGLKANNKKYSPFFLKRAMENTASFDPSRFHLSSASSNLHSQGILTLKGMAWFKLSTLLSIA